MSLVHTAPPAAHTHLPLLQVPTQHERPVPHVSPGPTHAQSPFASTAKEQQ